MYPNPASNLIRFEGDTPLKEIEVYNAEGKLILKKKIQNTEGNLDISHFAKGLYLLKINTENGPAEAKFVKE